MEKNALNDSKILKLLVVDAAVCSTEDHVAGIVKWKHEDSIVLCEALVEP